MPPAAFDPARITAAILAGGAGSRLGGRDKGLEPLGAKPLIAHVVSVIGPQARDVLVCANRNEVRYALYGRVLRDAERYSRGPLAGIATALAVCGTQWLLTVPVDCPNPPPDLAARLHAAVANDVARAAVAHDGARAQPLFALYSREVADSARAALDADTPVWRWQRDIGAAEVDFSDRAGAFANLNERQEFERWEREHG